MIWIILVVLSLAGPALFIIYGKTTSDKVGGSIATFIVGAGLFVGLGSMIILQLAPANGIHVHYTHKLTSISAIANTDHTYYLGVSYQDGDRVINYIDNGNNVPAFENYLDDGSEYDGIAIFQNASTPTVREINKTSDLWWLTPWKINISYTNTIELHVPSGTVLDNFKIHE